MGRLATENMVDEVFNEFWKELICNEDGSINIEQLKKELFDFHHIIGQVPEVYDHVTGGKLSKPNYNASVVISEADEYVEEQIDQAINNEYEELIMRWPVLEEICPKEKPSVGWRTWFMHNIFRIGGDSSVLELVK